MIICGLDECGRGPLAGPIAAAAVIFRNQDTNLKKLVKDSKKLSDKQRRKLCELIIQECEWAVEMVSVRQINNKGIGWANKEIFKRLIKKMDAERFIVDGNLKIRVKGKSSMVSSVVKADSKYPEVMAASIVAKVTRDELMDKLHQEFDMYGWKSNKGYGTRHHIQAIRKNGVCRHHRRVFVRTALGPHP